MAQSAPVWVGLSQEEYDEQLSKLTAFVDQHLRVAYRDYLDKVLHDCWAQHPAALWELGNLWAEWNRIYDRGQPSLTGALTWHDRWLPGVKSRLGDIMHGCREDRCSKDGRRGRRHRLAGGQMSRREAREEAAHRYADAGWHVFPAEPGGKRPIPEHGYLDATTLHKAIQQLVEGRAAIQPRRCDRGARAGRPGRRQAQGRQRVLRVQQAQAGRPRAGPDGHRPDTVRRLPCVLQGDRAPAQRPHPGRLRRLPEPGRLCRRPAVHDRRP